MLTKAESARYAKLEAYAATLSLPNATITLFIGGGVKASIRRHDVMGTNYRGERYIARRGYSDSYYIGCIDEPLVVLKRRLADLVAAN